MAACPLSGWSAVTSAQANAALAAVLAGFMLNGIVLLLSNNSWKKKPGYVQALSLLFAAFVVLGLDSYLFGLVTGDAVSVSCRRAWTEAMYAAGLLGIGAVAIIAAFIFLLAVYIQDVRGKREDSQVEERPMRESLDMLVTLCNSMRGAVLLIVLVILYMTARSYLYATLTFQAQQYPSWVQSILQVYLGFGILAGIVLVVIALTVRNRKTKTASDSSAAKKKTADVKLVKKLRTAIYSSVIYSLFSVGAASFFASLPVNFWNPTHFWVRAIIAGTAFWVLGVSLVPLWFLVVRLVPPFGQEDDQATSPALDPAQQP